MTVCPVDAIKRNEEFNVVSLDSDSCIGCRECLMACPFGALSTDSNGKMVKCDLCLDRLEDDLLPACVESCPQEVLKYIDEEEYSEAVKQNHVEQIMESMRYVRNRSP
jgi:Fe-S-cluster-containing dehydrogenase component